MTRTNFFRSFLILSVFGLCLHGCAGLTERGGAQLGPTVTPMPGKALIVFFRPPTYITLVDSARAPVFEARNSESAPETGGKDSKPEIINRDPQRENNDCISNRAWQTLVHGSRGRKRRFHDRGRTPRQDLLRSDIGTSRKIQSTLFIQNRGQTGAGIEGFQRNHCLIHSGRENDGSPRLRGLQYAVHQIKAISELSPMDAKARVR